jgi:hypothetical protein
MKAFLMQILSLSVYALSIKKSTVPEKRQASAGTLCTTETVCQEGLECIISEIGYLCGNIVRAQEMCGLKSGNICGPSLICSKYFCIPGEKLNAHGDFCDLENGVGCLSGKCLENRCRILGYF